MNTNIQSIIDALQCFKTNPHKCLQCDYNPHAGMPWPYGCIAGQYNIIDDALALLKAQEPKLVHVTADINRRKIGECPNCGKMINSGDYPNYCGRCGQAVKWE